MSSIHFLSLFVVLGLGQLSAERIWRLEDLEITSSASVDYINTQEFLPMTPVTELMEDENRRFRGAVYRGILGNIYRSNSIEESRQLTELFTQGLGDERAEDYVIDRLSKPPFEKDFFNERSKENVLQMGLEGGDKAVYIKVLGVMELNDPRIDLEQLSDKKDAFEDMGPRTRDLFANLGEHLVAYDSSFWAALLVEARRGYQEAIQRVLAEAGGIDPKLLVIPNRHRLVEDLGYIRQNESIDLLVEFLFSEIPPIDERVSGDSITTPLSHHAIRGLSQSLVGFPVGYWDPITNESLEEAREFIRNYEGPWRIIGKWKLEKAVRDTQSQASAATDVEEVVFSTDREIEKPPSAVHEEDHVEQLSKEKTSRWWLLISGALILLTGLCIVLARKKSSFNS